MNLLPEMDEAEKGSIIVCWGMLVIYGIPTVFLTMCAWSGAKEWDWLIEIWGGLVTVFAVSMRLMMAKERWDRQGVWPWWQIAQRKRQKRMDEINRMPEVE